eukprot:TRINITY_DN7815_c0_g1_i1.p1 TRINITY_DN7815_c0_g1~~TRINITY_DN7815_c0_g1_i1.p1  ORF type:complete len:647 (-),score=100.09 TRINITY_DN7815_c0_g1_i1:61-2001(-)
MMNYYNYPIPAHIPYAGVLNALKRKDPPIIKNHVLCIGCSESYVKRIPKNLTCGHVLCEKCCERIKVDAMIACPTCQARTLVNSNNVDDLPTNFPLKNIALHIDSEDQKKKKFVKCTEHGKSCKVFCQTCQKLICTMCAILSHTSHENETVDQAAETRRVTLREQLEVAKISLTEIVTDITTTRSLIRRASTKKCNTEKEIKSSLDKLRFFIDQKESEILGIANSQISATLTQLNRKNILLKEMFNKSQNSIQNIEETISNKENSSDILLNSENYVEQLKEIKAIETECMDGTQNLATIKEIDSQNPPVLFFKGFEDDIEIQQLINTAINKVISKTLLQKDHSQIKASKTHGPKVASGLKTYQFKGLSFVTVIPSNWLDKDDGEVKSDILVVTDTFAHKVILLEKETGALHLVIEDHLGKNLKSPRGVCAVYSSVAPHVKILVCCVNSLQLYDTKQGKFLSEFTYQNNSGPHAVDIIPHTRHFVVTNIENNSVIIHKGFSGGDDEKDWGQILKVFGKENFINFDSPTGLAINSKGNLIITSYNGARVYILDNYKNDFKVLKTFGGPGQGDGKFDGPFGVAVDCCDNILVTNSSTQNIQIFNENGTWLQTLGKGKNEGGELLHPLGIFVDHMNDILVVDQNNYINIF